jgi:hypothetical protein
MILLLLSCGEEIPISVNEEMVPIASHPLEGERVSLGFAFEGEIPSGVTSATIAIMVWDTDGNEHEYALFDSDGEYSYLSQAYFEPDTEYCWSAWYYPANSRGYRSAPNCFVVTH